MASRYLGRVMMAGDYEYPEVVGNLQKSRKSWRRLSRISIREGLDLKVSGNFFKAVIQAVLLFGAEMRVLTPVMERDLGSSQHRFVRWLTGRHPRRTVGGSWGYPSSEEAMVVAGFKGIGTYATRRQSMVAQYIATRPILDRCERSVRRLRARVSRR